MIELSWCRKWFSTMQWILIAVVRLSDVGKESWKRLLEKPGKQHCSPQHRNWANLSAAGFRQLCGTLPDPMSWTTWPQMPTLHPQCACLKTGHREQHPAGLHSSEYGSYDACLCSHDIPGACPQHRKVIALECWCCRIPKAWQMKMTGQA